MTKGSTIRQDRAPERSEPAARPTRFGRAARMLLGMAIAAGLIAAIFRIGDLQRFLELIRHARPAWLLGAAGLQVGTYIALALGWQAVLQRANAPMPLKKLMPLALAKLFADQAIPSAGVGGYILLVDRLMALGVPRGAAMATLLVSMVGFYASYAVLSIAMLVVLWLHGRATPLMVGLVTSFLLVALAIPSLALWLRARGSRPLPQRIERLGPIRDLLHAIGDAPRGLVRDRRLVVRVAMFNGLVFFADSLTLACCLAALGQPAAVGAAFVALMAASVVVTLGPIPLGLGSFEATATAMLHALGTPIEAAITATLMLRGFTLWLPLLPGGLLLRQAVRRKPR
jgi:uncharacterized membrane protein YbhN (UPF0104 family)